MRDPMEETPKPTRQTTTKHTYARLFGLLAVLCLIAGGIALIWSFIPSQYTQQQMEPVRSSLWDIRDAALDGDLQGALAASHRIQEDPTASSDDRARALLFALGMQYRLSGDLTALSADIANLKRMIVDESVSATIRADLVSGLAGIYAASGDDPKIFTELFEGEPFSAYRIPGDRNRSLRNLYEWSYAIAPTSLAAVHIARLASMSDLETVDGTRRMSAAAATEAAAMLLQAETLSLQEIANDKWHSQREAYFWYRYWHVVITGRLAIALGEPYLSQYRAMYEELLTYISRHPDVLAKETLLFGRLNYARVLIADGDEAAAKEQLDLIGSELPGLSYASSNTFISYMRNAHDLQRDGWTEVRALSQVSPDFKAAIEMALGVTIE